MKQKMKGTMTVVSLVCVVLLVTPVCTAGLYLQGVKKKNNTNQRTSQSDHWALLFAVGTYYNAPDEDRPEMLQACDDLYNTLVDSPQLWQPDHIHTVKGSQATGQNLIKELLRLKQNSDSEDYVLVYITTHGSQLRNSNGLPLDLPPKDEADGADEFLVMYDGFDKWYAFIWDDMLNFFLSIIPCKGMCLIVDSCYSGGFNDPPIDDVNGKQYTAESFSKGFAEDVAAQGRVVLMSAEENTLSYGSIFSGYLTSGFQGWADFFGNGDGINSAEESFAFAQPLVSLQTGGDQNPTIYDAYPGEFPITTS
jgi:heme exporter protein D